MAEITLSGAVRNNLLSLQNTAKLLGKTQERLSTGLRVGSALDDPTAFFTAQSLNSRAGDLSRLLDSVGLAVQSLESADNAISAITDLVESAQATARQAQQAAPATLTAATVTGTTATLTGTTALDDALLGIANAETLTLTDGTNNYTYTVANATTETVQDVIDGINGSAVGVTASLVGGSLVLTADNPATSFTVGGTGVEAGFGITAQAYDPTVAVASDERADLQTQFNSVLTQIDQLAADAGFNGINLLQSDNLEVTFNESGTSSLTIAGVDFDSGGLGINAVAGDGFQLSANIDAALTELDTAIATLRTQASTFGSNLSVVETRQNFTENLINTLETGAANLTLADTNEEGANMLALQTRQQLSSVALSLASQADQNVLRLF